MCYMYVLVHVDLRHKLMHKAQIRVIILYLHKTSMIKASERI